MCKGNTPILVTLQKNAHSKKHQPNISKLYSLLTEVMASSHHRHLLRDCSYTPSLAPWVCKQSLPPNLLTCLEVWVWATVCFTCIAGLVPWQGIKENNTWQGRRASHCSEKKRLLTTAALPAPLPLLPLSPIRNELPLYHLPLWCWLYWGYGIILAIFNSTGALSLFALPAPIVQNTASWEGSLICCSTEKCEICPRNPQGSSVGKRNPCIHSKHH